MRRPYQPEREVPRIAAERRAVGPTRRHLATGAVREGDAGVSATSTDRECCRMNDALAGSIAMRESGTGACAPSSPLRWGWECNSRPDLRQPKTGRATQGRVVSPSPHRCRHCATSAAACSLPSARSWNRFAMSG